jgi:hypothetical protein
MSPHEAPAGITCFQPDITQRTESHDQAYGG